MLDVDLRPPRARAGASPARPEQIVEALLYRPAAPRRNCQERFQLGRVYPEAYCHAPKGAGRCTMQTECLLLPQSNWPVLEVYVQFLQPVWRDIGVLPVPQPDLPEGVKPQFVTVPEWSLDGQLYQTWQEAVERTVAPIPLTVSMDEPSSSLRSFEFAAGCSFEPIRNSAGQVAAVFARRHDFICGLVELEAAPLSSGAVKVTIRVSNDTPLGPMVLQVPEAVLMRTFTSTHTILHAHGAEFISLVEPPAPYREEARACRNLGTWPVLVGEETGGERHTLLSSPVVLEDYPKILSPVSYQFTHYSEGLTDRKLQPLKDVV
jgi:hypothetical protein